MSEEETILTQPEKELSREEDNDEITTPASVLLRGIAVMDRFIGMNGEPLPMPLHTNISISTGSFLSYKAIIERLEKGMGTKVLLREVTIVDFDAPDEVIRELSDGFFQLFCRTFCVPMAIQFWFQSRSKIECDTSEENHSRIPRVRRIGQRRGDLGFGAAHVKKGLDCCHIFPTP